MRTNIECCFYCTAPKRHPGCHGNCPDYLEERAEYDKRKAEVDKIKAEKSALYGARADKVIKANKRKRNRRAV